MAIGIPSYATHTLTVFAQDGDLRLIEITEDGAERQAAHRFHVVRYRERDGQVSSAVPGDFPADGGTWVARPSVLGVCYVSNGRTLPVARRWMRRIRAADEAIEAGYTLDDDGRYVAC